MKIALAQMKLSSDIDDNFAKTVNCIKKASENDADLILFPEINLTPFFPQYEKLDDRNYLMDLNSEYVRGIQKACKKHNIHASPNLYILENGKPYDMSLLIDNNGDMLGNQKMVHVKQAEYFYEKSYYTPSDDGFNVFETVFGKIAIVICFDRHFPESIRTATLKGAQMILIPTANTTFENDELFKWEIQVQAFQNNVFVAMCNRTGIEDKMEFSGKSIVSDVDGNVVAIADNSEMMLFADIDLKKSDKKEYVHLRREGFY